MSEMRIPEDQATIDAFVEAQVADWMARGHGLHAALVRAADAARAKFFDQTMEVEEALRNCEAEHAG